MSKEYINQITLDCLLNKEQFANHINNKIKKSINKKDKKFYRKRIFDLTKLLLINKEKPEDLFPDVKYAFDNYLKTCINYFKAIDNNDIIQDDYKDLENENDDKDGNVDDNIDEKLNNINLSREKADKLMLRSIKLKPSLDNFIQKIPKKTDEIVLPKQKNIKLDNPELKTKGIKKKNITNKYGENNKSKEETKIDTNENKEKNNEK